MFTTITTLFLFIACSFHTSGNEYTLNGSFNKDQNEKWIYLVRFMDPQPKVDSTRIVNGKFTFKGTIDYPEVYGLHYRRDRIKGIAPIFLEPGELEIVIDPDDWTFNSKITGGKVNEAYNDFAMTGKEKYQDKIMELSKKKSTVDEKGKEEINRQIKSLMDADYHYKLDYVKAHPASPESIFIFSWIFGNLSDEELGKMLSDFSPEIQKTIIYQSVSQIYETKSKLKNISKALVYDGKIKNLDVRFGNASVIQTLLRQNPGKTLYIDFWAPWCGPCIKEFPYSKKLHEKLSHEKVAFLYVCINVKIEVKKDSWKEMIVAEKLNGQHYLWGQSLIDKFFEEIGSTIVGIPRYVIIDDTGKVISDKAPGPSADTVEKLLLESKK
jgi:thiol-disulfide isomerase/thioredoxin